MPHQEEATSDEAAETNVDVMLSYKPPNDRDDAAPEALKVTI